MGNSIEKTLTREEFYIDYENFCKEKILLLIRGIENKKEMYNHTLLDYPKVDWEIDMANNMLKFIQLEVQKLLD